jgi:hypothetical protein
MAACQPTNLSQMHPIPCGSELARDGGLTANQSLPDAPNPTVGAGLPAKTARQPTNLSLMHPTQLWDLACQRRRPASQPISPRCTQSNCGSWPASDGGLTANQSLPDVPNPTVGASLLSMETCQPTNLSQMYPFTCGSELARDGGLPANQSLPDVPNPPGNVW